MKASQRADARGRGARDGERMMEAVTLREGAHDGPDERGRGWRDLVICEGTNRLAHTVRSQSNGRKMREQ
jgi:hypothetical protein